MANLKVETPVAQSIFCLTGQGITEASFSSDNRSVMVLEFSEGITAAVPALTDEENNTSCVVDWGDGTSERFDSSQGAQHTYTTSDTHRVRVHSYIDSIGSQINLINPGGVTAIELPLSLRKIGANAFLFWGLESVTIPPAVEQIGSGAFAGNPLTEVTVSHSCKYEADSFPCKVGFYPFEQTESTVADKILYSDSTGAKSVTLSEVTDDYDYLTVFLHGVGSGVQCVTVPAGDGEVNAALTLSPVPGENPVVTFLGCKIKSDGTALSVAYSRTVSFDLPGGAVTTGELSDTTGYIVKVIGHKAVVNI